jgi:hypothetical protein
VKGCNVNDNVLTTSDKKIPPSALLFGGWEVGGEFLVCLSSLLVIPLLSCRGFARLFEAVVGSGQLAVDGNQSLLEIVAFRVELARLVTGIAGLFSGMLAFFVADRQIANDNLTGFLANLKLCFLLGDLIQGLVACISRFLMSVFVVSLELVDEIVGLLLSLVNLSSESLALLFINRITILQFSGMTLTFFVVGLLQLLELSLE